MRAAFYFKEALQLLLHMNNTTNPSSVSTCSLISKIGAYKSFSEISPILQFANFTCNQALLEACEGFDRIHVIDFDIGFGGQWASLMQELAMRDGGVPSLKITAFASPSSHDEVELSFTEENLRIFASEINMPFEVEILGLESLTSGSWSLPRRVSETEVIAVNLPIGPFSNYPSSLPVALRFVKQLSPKVVVSSDKGCDRTDLPFAHHVNHSIQSYSSLLESLEAVNMNLDACKRLRDSWFNPVLKTLYWVVIATLIGLLLGGVCFCSLGSLHSNSVTLLNHKLSVWCSELLLGDFMLKGGSLHWFSVGSERSSSQLQLGRVEELEIAFQTLVLLLPISHYC
ncbi:hypothetical protein GH714_018753 [Hevea brasiliensis]|uniref:Uncharacterized protein n=1 Tax=Hevea brasiliensis TaxID=3981 RepID=A0A6A6LR05_HEVBR|nr:hypothetical protein GH714_018753 [Hevea brasiliensis]